MSRKPDLRSIETRRRKRRDGTELVTYRVRWTGPDGRRENETFDDLDAAIALRDDLDRRAALIADGPAARRSMTVADCYEQWHRQHVVPELATRTQASYEGVWQRHLAARIGSELAIDVRRGTSRRCAVICSPTSSARRRPARRCRCSGTSSPTRSSSTSSK